MVVMNLLGVKLGFGFSAGLFDYVLGFGISTRPLLLIPVGLAYFAVYYFSFRWCIQRFNLKTPGRERSESAGAEAVHSKGRGQDFVLALGGRKNLRTVDACMTRLRLELVDPARVDEARLKQLGARGLVRPGGSALQVVLGPIADQVAGEIRRSLHGQDRAGASGDDWVTALGGRHNIEDVQLRSSRLILRLRDTTGLNETALKSLGARAVAISEGARVHLLLDEATAESVAAAFAS